MLQMAPNMAQAHATAISTTKSQSSASDMLRYFLLTVLGTR